MTNKERFMIWLLNNKLAEAATISTITGTVCPCMASRDSSNPSYSAEWHVLNPTAAACSGIGLISTTTTSINIKAVFSPLNTAGSTIPTGKEFLETIGEIQMDDLFMWGTINTDTNAFIDISGKSEYTSYITKSSIKYVIRDVSNIPGDVGQVAHLVRRAS